MPTAVGGLFFFPRGLSGAAPHVVWGKNARNASQNLRTVTVMSRWFTMFAAIASFATAHAAPETARRWIHLNGYTHHFAAPDANDQLFGAGLTWYAQPSQRLATAWELDAFQDSGRKLSVYLGRSWTRRFDAANVGATAALMYHQNFRAHNRWRLLPVALPFVETSLGVFKARAYYIPPVRNRCDHQIALQLLVPFSR
jgi:hypothetical protein